MTDELVFQAKLILKIKQKQDHTVACSKPLMQHVAAFYGNLTAFPLAVLIVMYASNCLTYILYLSPPPPPPRIFSM